MGLEQVPTLATLPDSRVVVKSADETVNNSNVLQDDDDLFFAIGANEVWWVDLVLRCLQDNAAADFKFAVTAPAGATGWHSLPASANGGSQGVAFGTARQIQNAFTSEFPLWICALVINAGLAGAIKLQWSQDVQTVADNKVLARSFLRAVRLA